MELTKIEFQLVPDWERETWRIPHKDICSVAVDSRDRVYLLARAPDRVLVYSRDGAFLRSWGEGIFTDNHGISVGPDDSVYVVDYGAHAVRKFTSGGRLLLTLGTPGVPSDTGYDPRVRVDVNETVRRPAGPFNKCTNCAIAPNGDIYVADGYGNCRVHRFSEDGTLIQSWGVVGVGRGGFHVPHGIAIDPQQGRVLVADRQNDLLQIFDLEGRFLDQWTDVYRPAAIAISRDGLVFVAEMWRGKGGNSFRTGVTPVDQPGRVSAFDARGTLVARFGASPIEDCALPGNFIIPHGIAVDSAGDVYVAETTGTYLAKPEVAGPARLTSDSHQIQKLTRVRGSAAGR